MAWSNNASKGSEQRAEVRNEVVDLLLWCFEQTVKGDYVRLSCKLPSKAPQDAGKDARGQGIRVSVMARISNPTDKSPLTQIEEDDYSKGWIHVHGRLQAGDWIDKNKQTQTDLTVWATKVHK